MSTNRDGLREATNIFEAAIWHRSVKVECRCGHTAYFQAHSLWWRFKKLCWSDEFRDAPGRFYCSRCMAIHRRKVWPRLVEASTEPADITLPMPDEREWKRAIQRFRC